MCCLKAEHLENDVAASSVSDGQDVQKTEHLENDVAASSVSDRQDVQKTTHQPCPGFPLGLTYSLRHADLLQILHVGHCQCLELWWSCQPLLIHQQRFCIHHFAQNACDKQSPLSLPGRITFRDVNVSR